MYSNPTFYHLPCTTSSRSHPMWRVSTIHLEKWLPGAAQFLISILSAMVFTFLDFLDSVMCVFYRFLDELVEGKASSCYCMQRKDDEKQMKKGTSIDDHGDDNRAFELDQESELSETLYRRKNFFRNLSFFNFLGGENIAMKRRNRDAIFLRNVRRSRWSDCGCDACGEWMSDGSNLRLHVVVKEPSHEDTQFEAPGIPACVTQAMYEFMHSCVLLPPSRRVLLVLQRLEWSVEASLENCKGHAVENVIFLHGFISSSSFWAEAVFPNLSESIKQNYRLFAVDLLGFGKSPKPRDCLYTMRDHLEMIEKTVIRPFQLNSFHLVAHSMGCVIALALGAKYSESVKTITLTAPPYFPSKEDASLIVLERLAARRIWPPLLFGSAFMSWYEHLGRCVCFLICRNHRTWEWILKLLTCRRNLHFIIDLTKHTHHSAWHTMHNVICGGAKLMERYLEVLSMARVRIHVIHGTRDQVVPLECSNNIKTKVPNTEVNIIQNADHCTVIIGREAEFTKELEHVWVSTFDSIAETCVKNNNF